MQPFLLSGHPGWKRKKGGEVCIFLLGPLDDCCLLSKVLLCPPPGQLAKRTDRAVILQWAPLQPMKDGILHTVLCLGTAGVYHTGHSPSGAMTLMPIAPLDWAGRELGLFHRATGQQQNSALYLPLP